MPQVDTTGLGIIVVDALSRVEWVKEEELADKLNMQLKLMRRTMQYLEKARRS